MTARMGAVIPRQTRQHRFEPPTIKRGANTSKEILGASQAVGEMNSRTSLICSDRA